MSDRDFTLKEYVRLIKQLAGFGYDLRRFHDARADRSDLILRHDVDVSLEYAVRLAEEENRHGIFSTYFVLIRGEFYNILSSENVKRLERIVTLGHDIGLHFDAALYEDEFEPLNIVAEKECSILEDIIDRRVDVISFHRPAQALLGLSSSLADRMHAYQPRFFQEMGYCSDSRGKWHHGHPLQHSAVNERRGLQLLTHPIWWTNSTAEPEEKLVSFLTDTFSHLDLELQSHCATHRAGNLKAIRFEEV